MVLIILISIIFSILSTAIMSYISMATATGPWIEPTLVLLGIILFRMVFRHIITISTDHAIAYATAAGGIGGIVAIACGWAFPTLYFLQPDLFMNWIIYKPLYFIILLSMIVLVAGSFGCLIAYHLHEKLLHLPDMTFPIGELVQKMIYAQQQVGQAIQLIIGGISALVLQIIHH